MVPKAAASLLPVITMKIFGRKNQEGVLIKAPDQKLECEGKWSFAAAPWKAADVTWKHADELLI